MIVALWQLPLQICFSQRISFLLLLSFFLEMQSSSASEQNILNDGPVNPLDAKFKKLVNDTLELWHVPGVAIAVVDGNNTWAEVSVQNLHNIVFIISTIFLQYLFIFNTFDF